MPREHSALIHAANFVAGPSTHEAWEHEIDSSPPGEFKLFCGCNPPEFATDRTDDEQPLSAPFGYEPGPQ
jgi:hypothetical protein